MAEESYIAPNSEENDIADIQDKELPDVTLGELSKKLQRTVTSLRSRSSAHRYLCDVIAGKKQPPMLTISSPFVDATIPMGSLRKEFAEGICGVLRDYEEDTVIEDWHQILAISDHARELLKEMGVLEEEPTVSEEEKNEIAAEHAEQEVREKKLGQIAKTMLTDMVRGEAE